MHFSALEVFEKHLLALIKVNHFAKCVAGFPGNPSSNVWLCSLSQIPLFIQQGKSALEQPIRIDAFHLPIFPLSKEKTRE